MLITISCNSWHYVCIYLSFWRLWFITFWNYLSWTVVSFRNNIFLCKSKICWNRSSSLL